MADPFAITGIVLAVPGLVDLAIKYASFLKEKYDLYKDMDRDQRLYKLIIKCVEGEVHEVLMFYHKNAASVTPTFRDNLDELFQAIRDCVESVVSLVTDKTTGVLAKVGYSLHGAKKLSKKCEALEAWQKRFLDRAIVFRLFGMPIAAEGSVPSLPAQAQAGIFDRLASIRGTIVGTGAEQNLADLVLDDDEDFAELKPVADSKLFILQSTDTGSYKLAEYKTYTSTSDVAAINPVRVLVRELAARLSQADPGTMGILKCLGYSQEPRRNRFALHFAYPEHRSNPRSLQSLMMDEQNRRIGLVHSMSDRLRLAKSLAAAVFYVHAGGFVHKQINSTNVIVFEDPSHPFPYHIGQPYLAGFDAVRKADAASVLFRVEDWKSNIYLHPDRHRLQPNDYFKMEYDIYSLGIVLLEIACWGSFVDKKGLGKALWEVKKDATNTQQSEEMVLLDPIRLRKQYLKVAKRKIPPTLGDKYREVVVSCLDGLEKEGDHKIDGVDTVVAGLAYIDQVMEKLNEIEL
jgi:hypothetical protein